MMTFLFPTKRFSVSFFRRLFGLIGFGIAWCCFVTVLMVLLTVWAAQIWLKLLLRVRDKLIAWWEGEETSQTTAIIVKEKTPMERVQVSARSDR